MTPPLITYSLCEFLCWLEEQIPSAEMTRLRTKMRLALDDPATDDLLFNTLEYAVTVLQVNEDMRNHPGPKHYTPMWED